MSFLSLLHASQEHNLISYRNYGSMAVIAFIALLGFWIQFRDLDKQEDELNALPEGHHVGGARDAEEHAIPQAASQDAS